MQKLIKSIFTPSDRLNRIVICGVVTLLVASLVMMFLVSHRALKREARLNAEQTLEATVQHVDNILLSVEQSTGNIYSEMVNYLDQPDVLTTYCRQLIQCNPHIVGCAICFKPDYFPGRHLYMIYVHPKGGGKKKAQGAPLIVSDKFGSRPYTEHLWYSVPMTKGKACWTDPLPEEEDEGVTLSFCLPIYDKQHECVGVLAADLSVDQLSQNVLTSNVSSHGYSVLLASNGSFIVHPDQAMRSGKTIFTQEEYGGNSTILHAAKVMLAGEEGSMPFRQKDQDWIVFFKPFLQTDVPGRSMEQISWSIGVVYSEDQIFDTYNTLLFYVVAISIIGLLVFYLLCRFVIRRQMRSLQRLTHAAQRVSEGHYDDPMPPLRREDEIGLLYQNFEAMKQSLDNHVKELTDLTRTLKRRREVTREIYAKEQSVDRMKSFFLYFVTNQMIAPAEDIECYVKTLSSNYHDLSPTEVSQIVGTIDMKSNTIIEMINDILNAADDETGKEVDHA